MLKYLNDLLAYVEYYNNMSPFPMFDTEYVEEIKKSIIKMSNNEYNEIPVAACKHCNSLHIVNDDEQNDHCMRCGSINDIVMYNHIDDYVDSIKLKVNE
jgi:hypothetical protein